MNQRCWTKSPQKCHTAAARPSSARCRARRGLRCQAFGDRCRARLLRCPRCFTAWPSLVSRAAYTAVVQSARITGSISGLTQKSPPSPVWPPSGGQTGGSHARSIGINKPCIGISSNRKPRPRQQIDAVLDQRSQPKLGRLCPCPSEATRRRYEAGFQSDANALRAGAIVVQTVRLRARIELPAQGSVAVFALV